MQVSFHKSPYHASDKDDKTKLILDTLLLQKIVEKLS